MKSKNPDNLLISWRRRKINGAHSKLYRSCCSMQGV
uniref:RepA3-like n=1 Tax=Serratia entomophila TaxID=42906 RepID=Q7BQV4_9GAMM|nr:RepA3-like [Serratia entomophila]